MRVQLVDVPLKRALDVVFCILALPFVLPVGLLIGALVKLTSHGPVLYRATRVGRDGKPFPLLKFRTMRTGAAGPGITRSGDDRITAVGKWLRATKLDELPQIVNVLRGEMSIVGPRPEDPRFVALYTPVQRTVLDVRPGMTSMAFLRFGHEQEFIERAAPVDVEAFYVETIMPEKLEIELQYLRDWSLGADMRILARTMTELVA